MKQFGAEGPSYSRGGKLRQGDAKQIVRGRGCESDAVAPSPLGHGPSPPGTRSSSMPPQPWLRTRCERFTTVPGHSPALALTAVK